MRDTEKYERREKKINKRKNGMRIDGRSVLTLVEIIKKKGEKVKKS